MTEATLTPLFEETVPGGGMWSWIIRRHHTLRITAQGDGANVGLMAYNAAHPLERLNLPDTLKALHTAKITRGHVLMTDMGRALFSVTEDTVGWHDPLGGHGNAALVAQKYGEAHYQEHRNGWHRNAHDNFLIELGKHGLGKRDLVANVNFFSRLDVDEDGLMHFHAGNAKQGDYVDLRAEMDVLVVLNTCQHPLDPSPAYAPSPITVTAYPTAPATAEDYCRNFRPENQRCLTLTERYAA